MGNRLLDQVRILCPKGIHFYSLIFNMSYSQALWSYRSRFFPTQYSASNNRKGISHVSSVFPRISSNVCKTHLEGNLQKEYNSNLSQSDVEMLRCIFNLISINGACNPIKFRNCLATDKIIATRPWRTTLLKSLDIQNSNKCLTWQDCLHVISKAITSFKHDVENTLTITRDEYQRRLSLVLGVEIDVQTAPLNNQTMPSLLTLREECCRNVSLISSSIRQFDGELQSRIEDEIAASSFESSASLSNNLLLSSSDHDDEMEIDDDNILENNTENAEQHEIKRQIFMRREKMTVTAEETVRRVLMLPHDESVVMEKFSIPMTRYKISCLRQGVWLNDEVINFYMQLLKERDDRRCELNPSRRKSWYFSSFFMEKLLESDKKYTFANVKRWSKKFDMFDMEKVFFPINLKNTHWTLAVIFMQRKIIRYYDSMAGAGDRHLKALLQYISDESKAKRGVDIDTREWELIRCTANNTPQQLNGVDCGVFATMIADFVTDDIPVTDLSQEDIPEFRRKICYAILSGKLSYEC